MEDYLFHCYLKWQKERYGNIFKQLHKVGVVMKILLITACILILSVFVFDILESVGIVPPNYSLLIMVFTIVLFIILKFYTDHYMVKNSYTRLDNYKDYCRFFKNWLVEHGIEDKELALTIMERKKVALNIMDGKISKNNERVDKVMQILIIPIALSMFGTILNIQTDIQSTMELGVQFLILISLTYLLCSFFVSVFNNVIIKQKQDNIISFVNDLQSVIDLKLYDNSLVES